MKCPCAIELRQTVIGAEPPTNILCCRVVESKQQELLARQSVAENQERCLAREDPGLAGTGAGPDESELRVRSDRAQLLVGERVGGKMSLDELRRIQLSWVERFGLHRRQSGSRDRFEGLTFIWRFTSHVAAPAAASCRDDLSFLAATRILAPADEPR